MLLIIFILMLYFHYFGVLIALFSFIYLYTFYIYNYWKRLGVYQEKAHTVFGNFKDVFIGKCSESDIYNRIYSNMKDEKFAGCYYFWKPVVLLKDPDIIKKIMVNDFDHFTDHPSISDFRKTDRIVLSLFTMEGPIWKSRRSLFTASFTPKKIKDYFKVILHHLDSLLPLLRKNADENHDIELDNFTSQYLINVISHALFGIETCETPNANSKFIECSKYTTDPPPTSMTAKKVLRYLTPKLYESFKFQTLPPKIWQSFYPFVKELVEYREENNILRDDIIGLMVRHKNNGYSDPVITLEEMVGHVYTFFEAGFNPTSLTLSFCLFELSKNQEVQKILRDEIDSLLKERNRELRYETLQTMEYLDKVVKETLRKYPPIGLIRRVCTKDYNLGEINIKKGTQVLIPVEALHKDPKYYHDPEKFDPGRSEQLNFTYLPFGAGPRLCIGMNVADIAVKIGLIKIISEFLILPSEKHKCEIEYEQKTIFLTIKSKYGIAIRLAHR